MGSRVVWGLFNDLIHPLGILLIRNFSNCSQPTYGVHRAAGLSCQKRHSWAVLQCACVYVNGSLVPSGTKTRFCLLHCKTISQGKPSSWLFCFCCFVKILSHWLSFSLSPEPVRQRNKWLWTHAYPIHFFWQWLDLIETNDSGFLRFIQVFSILHIFNYNQ